MQKKLIPVFVDKLWLILFFWF